jgi:preprotein translocase subunit SecA
MSRLTLGQVLSRWRGENLAFDLDPYRAVAREIVERAASRAGETDPALAAAAVDLRKRIRAREGTLEVLDEHMVEAFALVYETARRALGLTPFEEQLVAAIALHRGKVAEMETGEGKTLAAVFPAALSGLSGRGVHVLTTNDYLARRDARWMGPMYKRLGLRVGVVQQGMVRAARAEAHGAAVTYATASELGFDLLRDDLCTRVDDIVVRRPLHHAILDDIDSTLIDEARHPLVVAGTAPDPRDESDTVSRIDAVVAALEPGAGLQLDEHGERAFLTDEGTERVERGLGCGDLYQAGNLELLTQVNLSLHAHAVLRRDVDYLVRDGRVELIDEHKGRVALGRRFPDGLQGALEEKEGLAHTAATRVLASTTIQSVVRRYPRISGMTATARTAADELGGLYRLEVVVIPPHRPRQRKDYVDLVFTHGEARDAAVIEEVLETHAAGRPVLVGTSSVEASESLARALRERGVSCQVLNARNDEAEAEVIAEAGAPGAVTISTNMAGRGTDIRLGGRDEAHREQVAALGGLCVIGTHKNESERVDDQLRGRAGRQGDPGSSQVFAALDDELFARYGVQDLLPARTRGARLDEPLLDRKVLRELDRAQRIIAARNSLVRKTLWGYDAVVEGQRRTAMGRRRLALLGRAPGLLAEASPERHAALVERLGPDVVAGVEKQLTMAWIDRAWADHLVRLAVLREDMQLMSVGVSIGSSFGRERPLSTFRRLARESFEAFETEVDEGITATFERADITTTGIDLAAEGLAPPAETWTYVVEEQPLETRARPRFQVTLLKRLVGWLKG